MVYIYAWNMTFIITISQSLEWQIKIQKYSVYIENEQIFTFEMFEFLQYKK